MGGAVWWELLFTALLGFAFIFAPRDASQRRVAFSAYNIVLFLFFVYVAFPGALSLFNGERFIWAPAYGGDAALSTTLASCVAALVTFVVGNRAVAFMTSSTARREMSGTRRSSPRFRPPVWLPLVLVVLGLGLKAYLIASTGGLQETLLRMAGNGAIYDDVTDLDSSALLVRGLSGVADVGAVWIVLDAWRVRRHRLAAGVLFGLVMAMSYVTVGKRLALILPLLALVIGFSVLVRHISVKMVPFLLIAFLGFGMVTLLVRIFVPASAAQADIDLNQVSYANGSIFAFYFNSLEFSTVEMITVATRSAGAIRDSFGGTANAFFQINVVPFSFGIPRALWLDKPDHYYDLSYAISSLLNHQRVEDASVGYVSTLVGSSLVFGGLPGLIGAFSAFGGVVVLADRSLLVEKWSNTRVITYAFVLMCSFHFFRMGTLSWTYLIGVLQQDGFLLGALALVLAELRPWGGVRVARPPLTGASRDDLVRAMPREVE